VIVIDTALAFTPFKAHDEGQVRMLFKWASTLRSMPPHPAIIFVVHLRKPDQKQKKPTLLEDPYAWTDEILGSVVWSASADVRLGLEAFGNDGYVVFAGFRRGDGEVGPMIIEPFIEMIDGEPRATKWALVDPAQTAASVLSPTQWQRFQRLQVGQEVTWSQFLSTTGAPKVSAHRLARRAIAIGLLDHDRVRGVYRRKV
jgi:hypothetical protein